MGKKDKNWKVKEKKDIRAIAVDEIQDAFIKYDNGWYGEEEEKEGKKK